MKFFYLVVSVILFSYSNISAQNKQVVNTSITQEQLLKNIQANEQQLKMLQSGFSSGSNNPGQLPAAGNPAGKFEKLLSEIRSKINEIVKDYRAKKIKKTTAIHNLLPLLNKEKKIINSSEYLAEQLLK